MSFSSTPLGQGRRLDHHTFLNKNNPTGNAPQRRVIPTSYSYGAPTVGSRSPPKPDKAPLPHDDTEEPALVRFARLKQREQAQQPGPSTHPETWSVRDTSVNIVSAFHQAIDNGDASTNNNNMNPNEAWASGVRKQPLVPRSTSVEYEKETQSTINRRLAPPPNRLQQARVARPVSKNPSVRHVPDSEGEEEVQPNGRNGRAKTPLEQGIEVVRRLVPASFLLRERSQEPEASLTNGGDARDQSSYDYSMEEREFQSGSGSASRKPPSRRTVPPHRKNRISIDNKAYRPSMSDLDESDEDFGEDGKRLKRKKKKGGATGGPLTTLPVASYDRRKRRKKGTRENGAGGEGEEEGESSEEEERLSEQRSQRGVSPLQRPPSVARVSVPPQIRQPSVQPHYDSSNPETSMDLEGGQLEPLSEVDELPPMIDGAFPPRQASFSVGATLGRVVHVFVGTVLSFVRSVFSSLGWVGRVIVQLNLIKYALVAATIYLAWAALNSGMLDLGAIPSIWGPRAPYQPPSIPASDLAALSARLQSLEKAFASLSLDTDKSRDGDLKHRADVLGRLGFLETSIQKESSRAQDAENKYRATASENVHAVKKEVSQLSSQLQILRDAEARRPSIGSDQEARTKLKTLEERVVSVEGGVKDALDLSKSAAKAGAVVGSVAQWWNGLATGTTKGVTIKSSDGQDVTSLVNQLVDSAVLRTSKDTLGRADFALYSAGARTMPRYTSDTMEIRPPLFNQIFGFLSGDDGYAIGRPAVTALHHELHTGHCWPFPGSQGQLGVKLAAPVYITDVTIDHVPKEVALDMRSAPRQMELWGLLEGKDNLAKVYEWRLQRAAAREAAEDAGQPIPPDLLDDVVYPHTLPKNPEFIRIANFTYNIHAAHYIQTFPVREEIREMGVDFGLVVLFVKSNWGMDEFTCLYRLRVHGERMGEVPLPYPEEEFV